MKASTLKLIGYVVLLLVILNLILFAFVVTNWIVFWIVIAIAFIFVKWGLPKLKEKVK
ncbi:hypothetical protein HOI26_03270 [Candidatus Woesearchaeota archaeon]|jgi:hypothetical protein|nr:hypothetical protein [Candidatus Woesearchaeota archaeon]